MKKISLLIISILISANSFAYGNDFVKYPEPLRAPVSLFEDSHNNLKTLGNFQGKVVILNFWATWCKPCVVEMPSLKRLKTKYEKQGLAVVPLVGKSEDLSKVRSFYRRYKLTELGYYVDNSEITSQSYQVESVPTSFIFDKQGRLVASVSGSIDWMRFGNQKFIRELLEK